MRVWQVVAKCGLRRFIELRGEIQGADYSEVNYEGYGPHGVAIFVETLTDNINRTVADIRPYLHDAWD